MGKYNLFTKMSDYHNHLWKSGLFNICTPCSRCCFICLCETIGIGCIDKQTFKESGHHKLKEKACMACVLGWCGCHCCNRCSYAEANHIDESGCWSCLFGHYFSGASSM